VRKANLVIIVVRAMIVTCDISRPIYSEGNSEVSEFSADSSQNYDSDMSHK